MLRHKHIWCLEGGVSIVDEPWKVFCILVSLYYYYYCCVIIGQNRPLLGRPTARQIGRWACKLPGISPGICPWIAAPDPSQVPGQISRPWAGKCLAYCEASGLGPLQISNTLLAHYDASQLSDRTTDIHGWSAAPSLQLFFLCVFVVPNRRVRGHVCVCVCVCVCARAVLSLSPSDLIIGLLSEPGLRPGHVDPEGKQQSRFVCSEIWSQTGDRVLRRSLHKIMFS